MRPDDFALVKAIVHRRAGIALEAGKEYQVENRLGDVAKSQGLGSVQRVLDALRSGNPLLENVVAEAMTTNETSFFRDPAVFRDLTMRVLPALVAARAATREIQIWSAASASGQEPYSIAMAAEDFMASHAGWTWRITATDFAQAMLRVGQAGKYSQLEVNRGLPAAMLIKYFTQSGGDWFVAESLKRRIDWRRMNLIDPWPATQYDVIFLRNVLIYFDEATRAGIFGRLRRALRPGGFLAFGNSEIGIDPGAGFLRAPAGCGAAWFQRVGP